MKTYKEMNKDELLSLKIELSQQYEDIKKQGLRLNMARGKPDFKQTGLSLEILDMLRSDYDFGNRIDYCNYGILDGIDEAKTFFADMLDVDFDQVIICGNSSLNMMFNEVCRGYTHGYMGNTPWCRLDNVKFLCPVPGYDRHFAITEHFGIEMINIPFKGNGPDMDLVEEYVQNDESVKGIWCVPQYSNPNGITYSDEVVERFANLKPAAKDFRIFWDNAYLVHHLYEDQQEHVKNIIKACEEAGNPDLVFEFCSTSKITLPGAGVAAMASSIGNKKDILKHMGIQGIGYDKLNQFRHVLYLKDQEGLKEHMRKQAECLKPKFDSVLNTLHHELTGLDIGTWSNPLGGYFISFEALNGCAKAIVQKCKEAGTILTEAGAPFPYGKDPYDSNIRIAPSYPSLDELKKAAQLFTLCVKLVSIDKLLEE